MAMMIEKPRYWPRAMVSGVRDLEVGDSAKKVTRTKRSSRLVRRKEVQAVLMVVLRFMVEERVWFWWVGDGGVGWEMEWEVWSLGSRRRWSDCCGGALEVVLGWASNEVNGRCV